MSKGVSFDYEPYFPIGLMAADTQALLERTRLGSEWYDCEDDGFVSVLKGRRDEHGWQQFLDWLDRSGL